MTTDRIEKRTFLKAPRSRVWRAITDSQEFGIWFGMKLNGPFVPGAPTFGAITPTQMDSKVAEMQQPYAGKAVVLLIERMEPETLFSFRWHPGDPDLAADYSKEPTTLVTFQLEEVDGGTQLTLTETGFDQLPPALRKNAFEGNDGGWTIQMTLIAKYLDAR